MFEAKLKLPFNPILCVAELGKALEVINAKVQNSLTIDPTRGFSRDIAPRGATSSGEKRHRGAPTCKRKLCL
ncbi:hypothetical protein HYDPIDRAFT_120203 [Hydnomerulius pinastri MD-312]|uniref:Uncharacterized protein n=1 Tax=Hydnomerulius pinastri MD-312 TaxID=994086 RepID=A0A0C9VX52_9AGAM|nr:hypothetical protein HYDPIDRAFT_120203 [Hydnomerulius pinastri MD-312]